MFVKFIKTFIAYKAVVLFFGGISYDIFYMFYVHLLELLLINLAIFFYLLAKKYSELQKLILNSLL